MAATKAATSKPAQVTALESHMPRKYIIHTGHRTIETTSHAWLYTSDTMMGMVERCARVTGSSSNRVALAIRFISWISSGDSMNSPFHSSAGRLGRRSIREPRIVGGLAHTVAFSMSSGCDTNSAQTGWLSSNGSRSWWSGECRQEERDCSEVDTSTPFKDLAMLRPAWVLGTIYEGVDGVPASEAPAPGSRLTGGAVYCPLCWNISSSSSDEELSSDLRLSCSTSGNRPSSVSSSAMLSCVMRTPPPRRLLST
mmetsp:Transcript_18778/g.52304  ORF Transcript_18778/g.52304 Transcript_18778/m.52304 type:complete len:254 (-) Transcript_18778:1222-1983(-)